MTDKHEMTIYNAYTRSWKALQFSMVDKPRHIKEWLYAFWGFDIFFGRFPFLKIIILSNIIVWWVLWRKL